MRPRRCQGLGIVSFIGTMQKKFWHRLKTGQRHRRQPEMTEHGFAAAVCRDAQD